MTKNKLRMAITYRASAEPALFGVFADDLLSRWRALRGLRKMLEDDHE